MDLSPLAGLIEQHKRPAPRGAALKHLRLVKLAQRLAKLRAEGLALYCALPVAEQFHACRKKYRVVDGSNRAGKTLAAACESSRFLTGCDPYDKAIKTNGKAWIIGLDGDHLAMMWRTCAQPGAFATIRDEHTNLWRAVRPDPNDPLHLDPYDLAYREKWKDAPPLLPGRLIKAIAWEDKAKGIPRKVSFHNGWESLWRSSKGDSPQGDHLNLVWIDEQIENEDFYREGHRGIVGLAGEPPCHIPRLIWSATPQNLNSQLSDLRDAAERASLHVGAFKLLISQNPYFPDDEKQAFFEGLDYDEREVRWYGNPAVARQRVYPCYDPHGTHGYDAFAIDLSHWTRYIAVDPGRQDCGTVFFAIDPSEEHVWLYDAYDLRNVDNHTWAGEIARREHGMKFEAFVMDQQMGKQTRPGAGQNTAQIYFDALRMAGVRPKTEGPMNGFFPGMNNVRAREDALLDWLSIRGTGPFAGSPILRVQRGVSPDLDKQFRDAKYKHGKRDKHPAQDILVCVEYMAAFGPRYRTPVPVETREAPRRLTVHEQFLARNQRHPSGARQGTAIL